MKELKLDPEFENLIPDATKEEWELLEGSLLSDGCHTPLVIWRGVLIDGHRRYKLCTKHKINFQTRVLEVKTREEAIQWSITNQLSRRNLSAERISYLRGKYYNTEKLAPHRPEKGAHNAHLNLPPKNQAKTEKASKTAEKIAKENNVNPTTVRRDAEFARAVEILTETIGLGVKSEILGGNSPLSKKDVIAISKLPADKQAAAYNDIKSPKKKDENPKTSANPDAPAWAEFSGEVDQLAYELESIARKLHKALKFDTERKANEKYAYFMHYDGTVGAVRHIAKTLRENLPAEASAKPPGFIPVRQSKISSRVAEQKREG